MSTLIESHELADNVVFEAHYSDLSVFELYPDDTQEQLIEIIQKLDRYETVLFDAKVFVSIAGNEFGVQWLGGCHYGSVEDFLNDSEIQCMIKQAKDEAPQEIEDLIKELQGVLK